MDKIDLPFVEDIVGRVLQMESESIICLEKSMDYFIFKNTAEIILNCKGKVITTGCGTSGVAARKIAHSFSCIRRPAFFLSPSEALHGGLGAVTKDDIIILISKGGRTQELVNMMQSLITIGAMTIVVAENNFSPMAKVADICIEIPIQQEPDSFNMLATASTLATIAYFDAMIILIKEWAGFKKNDFLLIHPGGAVGERLLHETKKE
nr:SIS domain-containing protein [uncultured Sphaerochaeta sp.]